jgi:Tfp pilus assembly protein PilF
MSITRELSIRAFAIAAVFMSAAPAHAQSTCASPVAIVESVKNTVQLVQASTKVPQAAVRRVNVCTGDSIRVGENSRAVILILSTNTPLALDQNSELIITVASPAGQSLIDLLRGALLFISRTRQSLEIRTPFVNAAIEGTEFVLRVQSDRSIITVFEGAVRATNPLGSLVVGAGQQAVAVQGQPPVLEIPVRPRDAVQWAMYYEPLLPSDSFEQLARIPETQRGADFYLRQAALQLATGQVEAARAGLVEAQKFDPSNADVDALRAMTSVALNDTVAALDTARAAVQRNPKSAPAHLALSYALQATFDLAAAHLAAEEAIAVSPTNALTWARLAELRLAIGDVNGAVRAAETGAKLAPNVSRLHSVLGFAELSELDLSEAATAFERAIDLEPDSPLPRLGLGLVKIRRGRLAEGRRDLEIAAALSPGSSLIRSYLGKAYFDEKRDAFAAESFVRAKLLDPLDPTPWLYDAIRKQAINQPIGALSDIRESIRLNQNRAVYRSRFQLDADQAARSARLGRVYHDLGFSQLALLEATKSINADPTDYSGHRFLSDSYISFPRHEIARDSELLQAQLLQPLNINPVLPKLSDNGVTFLDESGISSVGFNEFSALYAANKFGLLVDGLAGNFGTGHDNVIVSGVFDRLSFSAGQFHFDTDGVRDNHRLRQDIINAFVQGTISSNTSAQAEVRTVRSALGDRRLLFDRSNFLPGLRSATDTDSWRIGGRHTFAPGSVMIASFTRRMLQSDFDTGIGLRVQTEDQSNFGELRYINV